MDIPVQPHYLIHHKHNSGYDRKRTMLWVDPFAELERQRQFAAAPSAKPNPELYNNAAVILLGVSDLKKSKSKKSSSRTNDVGVNQIAAVRPTLCPVSRAHLIKGQRMQNARPFTLASSFPDLQPFASRTTS